MKYLIELTEADSGLPTYGGIEGDKYASEVFVGGTTKRPAKLRFNDDGEWALFDLTAFHPDGREEQITVDEYMARLPDDRKLYEAVDGLINGELEWQRERDVDRKVKERVEQGEGL